MLEPPLLAVRGLDAFYGDFQALFGVAMEVARGEAVAVIGANGAGKSTLLKSIAGLLRAPRKAIAFAGEPIGGIQVVTAGGWFAARPSGTEDIYKVYAESFRGAEHLARLLAEAQRVVDAALANV